MHRITSKIQKYDLLSEIKFFSLRINPTIQDIPATRVAMDRTNPKSKFNWKTRQSNNRTMINIAPLAIWVPILFVLIVEKIQAE
jgi:hypothetical protein